MTTKGNADVDELAASLSQGRMTAPDLFLLVYEEAYAMVRSDDPKGQLIRMARARGIDLHYAPGGMVGMFEDISAANLAFWAVVDATTRAKARNA